MAEYILHKTKEETTLRTKKMYVSTPYNRVQAVEERLKKIFEDEKNQKVLSLLITTLKCCQS